MSSLFRYADVEGDLPPAAMPLTVSATSSWPTCTLSYRAFHLQWTLPLCLALYLINRPLLTRLDRAKLILLPAIAFVWTTPWDNLIVKNQAWFYRRHCIWFTVGYVPIEEYFFFVIQSVMTTLWCNLMTRWFLPNLYTSVPAIKSGRSTRPSTFVPPLTLILVAGGLWLSQPSANSYYMAMIIWWSAIPLGLLAWGTIDFVARIGLGRGLLPFLLSVFVPSAYLWASDIYALRRGTWHINERVSLNIFPIPDLPVEEMIFFVVTNAILVTACYAFDRCVAICRQAAEPTSETPLSPSFLPLNSLATYKALWLAFVQSDQEVQSASATQHPSTTITSDLQTSLSILTRASKSFSAASLLLPWDLRTDLSSLYAFCRVADDLVDEVDLDVDGKVERLRVVSAVLDIIYGQGDTKTTSDIEARRAGVRRLLEQSASDIPEARREEIRAAVCSILPLTSIVPRRLWNEMVEGYLMDLDFERPGATGLEGSDELVKYSQCVAGCVGEMCTRVILARCGEPVPLELEVDREIDLAAPGAPAQSGGGQKGADPHAALRSTLYEARRMGVSLQLVNIARDLVDDATQLKRCYIPLSMFDADERHFQRAMLEGRIDKPGGPEKGSKPVPTMEPEHGGTKDKEAIRVSPRQLRKYALRLLDLSDVLYATSYPALAALPNPPARAGLRAACAVYAAIGDKIRTQRPDQIERGERARMSTSDRLRKALAAIYFDS